jgi:hypothetical protein
MRPGLDVDPSPLLVPRFKHSRAIPLLFLRAFLVHKRGEPYLLFVFKRLISISVAGYTYVVRAVHRNTLPVTTKPFSFS